MASFTLNGRKLTLNVCPEKAVFEIITDAGKWVNDGKANVTLNDGRVYLLSESGCEAELRETDNRYGYKAVYRLDETLTLFTEVWVEKTRDDVFFESRLEGDTNCQVAYVQFPSAFVFDAQAGKGYSVLARMQGTIIPAGEYIPVHNGIIYERDAYMPIFGQVRANAVGECGAGYLAIFDTPYDARYNAEGDDIAPRFVPSLGVMSYPRRMLYRFFDDCDYNTMAKSYRRYLMEKGELVTLREKIAKNPNVERLLGAPIIHEGIATMINEKSSYYNHEHPEKNYSIIPFAQRTEELKALHARGLKKAYIHLDGWGFHGYDNLHPDPFPVNLEAGGAEAMKELSDTARSFGYIFGIHDQYRDYYYDAPFFSFDNAARYADGHYQQHAVWYGGPQTILCASLAPAHVRRNYDTFEELGIKIEGSYLDVFSVVELDECSNPDHPMTRKECAQYRRECLDILTSKGIIPSSEETLGCILPSQVLCHHAPFFTSDIGNGGKAVGVPIPLFNLVYHDCVVIPWTTGNHTRGSWGIPLSDCAYTYAVLNADPVYCPITADEARIAEVEEACEISGRLGLCEMMKHEFIDGDIRRQAATYSDGTRIEVNLDTFEFKVEYGD